MMGVLAGKVLCRLRVHSVDVWEYRQNAVCTQYGTCRCAAPCGSKSNTNTREEAARYPENLHPLQTSDGPS